MNFPYDFLRQIGSAPFYLDDDGILYRANFAKITSYLYPSSIDLIVTDPPYGINYMRYRTLGINSKTISKASRADRKSLIINDKRPDSIELFISFLTEAQRILKPGGRCCCCSSSGGGNRPIFPIWISLMSHILDYKQTLIWDKGGLGLGSHYRNSCEFILIAKKKGAKCTWNGGKHTSNIIKIDKFKRNKSDHPAQKPTELMAKLIYLHSNENEIVLDPFAGHGSTLLAAKLLKRKFTGIEIVKDYCKTIKKKLTQFKPRSN